MKDRVKNSPNRSLFYTFSVLTVCAFLASGCATTILKDGANLAKVGQTAAAQMEENVTLSGNSMLELKRAVEFNNGYNNQISNQNSQIFLTNMVNIQTKLTQYGKWLESLSSSYSALGDLAGYNASSNFISSMGSLDKSTTDFANSIGKHVAIPSNFAQGVNAVGGFFAQSRQANEVKEASGKIECILTNMIALLGDPDTKQQLVTIHQQVTEQIDQAGQTLLANGVGSYAPLINYLGGPLGITATPNADEIVKSNKKLLAGLNNVETELVDEQISSQESNYDKSLLALKALVPLHKGLQDGSPIDLSSITEITGQLKSIASELESIKGK